MIYTLTLNPALDYVMDAGDISFGATNRSRAENISFGGKGINVSVILSRLGISSVALGFIGGFTGEHLKSCIEKEGVDTAFTVLSSGDTRINVKLRKEGEITEVNSSGPEIAEQDLKGLFDTLEQIGSGDTLVLAGSLPKGVPDNIYFDIMQRLSARGVRFVVDTSGKALVKAVEYKPFLIKPNRDELEEIFGIKISSDEQLLECARRLKDLGAQNVLVSLGKEGAILLDENDNIHKAPSKKITPKNTVGAGDSMVAGFIAGAEKGYEYAIRLGTACGAATAASEGLAEYQQIKQLLDE